MESLPLTQMRSECAYQVVFQRKTKSVTEEEDNFVFGIVAFRNCNVAVYAADLFDLACKRSRWS